MVGYSDRRRAHTDLKAPHLFVRAEAIRTTATIRRPSLRAPWALLVKSTVVVRRRDKFHVIKFPAHIPTNVASDTKPVAARTLR